MQDRSTQLDVDGLRKPLPADWLPCYLAEGPDPMSEHEPREPLEAQIERKFRTVTTDALIRRIQRAADFGYDDEQYELNRRLKRDGLTWKWNGDKIEVIDLEAGDE